MHTAKGPPSQHLSLADLDDATLTLVIPAAGGGEASLWLGEPLPPFVVAAALRAVADEVNDDYDRFIENADDIPALPASLDPSYPRRMGEDHRSAVTGEYVSGAEAEAHPDTTVTEQAPRANLHLAATSDLIDELAERAEMARAAGDTWPDEDRERTPH
jgi:hypothetical protein